MLYFVPTPIGNLNDISFRSLEILKICEIIICEDTRVCKSLISFLNSKFNIQIKPKKFISLHTHNETQFFKNITLAFFDKNIAYMSDAGMPGISDPGSSLIKYALNHNLSYEVLPGANAALVALVSSGFCKKEFIFMGFLSNKGKERQKDIEKLLDNPYPSIVYESPKRILSLIETIANLEETREIFIMKEISKKFETKLRANAKDLFEILKNTNLKGEWVVVLKEKDQEEQMNFLYEKDILELDLPLKTKSKLLSKIYGKNSKELYKKLLLSQDGIKY